MDLAYWIHGFWLSELAMEPLLVLLLITRKVWRAFPFFTAYAVWSMVGDIAEYKALHHQGVYIYSYVVNETVSVALAIALTYEIFTHLFVSQKALRRLAWLSLCGISALLIVLGGTVILVHSPIGQKGIIAAVVVLEESCRILEVGLVVSLFIFSTACGLHWRRQVFGIVLGLGISASVKLAVVAINPHSYIAAGIANIGVMLSYDAGLLIWFGYFLIPERSTNAADLPKPSQLEQWNRAVMELIHQ